MLTRKYKEESGILWERNRGKHVLKKLLYKVIVSISDYKIKVAHADHVSKLQVDVDFYTSIYLIYKNNFNRFYILMSCTDQQSGVGNKNKPGHCINTHSIPYIRIS